MLIVGVAEPIILFYGYMYSFARGRGTLGADLFLPWAAWVCIWTACMLLAITALGACRYINRFTRFCGELFGMLIAVLFIQKCIRGVVRNFRPDADTAPLEYGLTCSSCCMGDLHLTTNAVQSGISPAGMVNIPGCQPKRVLYAVTHTKAMCTSGAVRVLGAHSMMLS